MGRFKATVGFACAVTFVFCLSFTSFAQVSQTRESVSINYLFRDSFYAPPLLKVKYDIYEIDGFLLVRDSRPRFRSNFAVVTDFEGPVLESRVLKRIYTIDEAREFIEKNARVIYFERIPIRELPLIDQEGATVTRYWVGQKAFPTLELAKAHVAETKTAIEMTGGNFDEAVQLVNEFFPEEPAPTREETKANFEREEELALKMMDWLGVGDQLYGPLTGTAMGERILWQSFGETSFRATNFTKERYDNQVAYWTNRMVFKGIKFLGEPTFDPYVEATVALDTHGQNFTKYIDLVAGVEYRPFGRSAFLENFNIDGLYLLRFARGYRLYVQYMERKALSDAIEDSADTDLRAGVDIFYEWGLDLERPWVEAKRARLSDWISDYIWGEYYGSYRWVKTDFSPNKKFHSWILNSNVTLGVKWPRIPLPKNPVNDEFLLMPYVRFEHVTNPNRDFYYQNQMSLAAGIRWMPFRSYQFENDEWLFKTKLFAEYVGIGNIHHPGPAKSAAGIPKYDIRFGVNVSYRRF